MIMRTQPHLAVVPSKPAVIGSRFVYVRGAVASPVCVAVTLFAACLGVGYAGLIGAIIANVFVGLCAGYVRGAVASPVCVAVTLSAACLAVGYAGLIGAIIANVFVALLGALARPRTR